METVTIGQGGGRKLTDNQKVEIAIQKEIRPTPTSTNLNIAHQFGVSKDLVNRISKDKLNEQQKALFEKRMRNLKYDALELTTNAIAKANELVERAENASHLGGVVAAMGKANEIYRLETNQSTSNVQVLDVAQIINKSLQTAAKLHRADPSEPLPNRAAIVENYAQLCARNGVEPDESLIDFSVIETVDNP